jgi:hypothetical protein
VPNSGNPAPASPSFANPAPIRPPAEIPAPLEAPEIPASVTAANRAEWADLQSSFDSASSKVTSARGAYEEMRARLESIGQSPRASLLTGVTNAESAIQLARQRMTAGSLEEARTEIRRADYIARQVLKEFGR